jgi:hypothetical protein
MALIFDIETVGVDFEGLDKDTQDNLTRWIKKDAEESEEKYEIFLADLKNNLGFSPLTGEIVAIGVFDSEKNKGAVYYQAPDAGEKETSEGNFSFKPMTEKEMLENFWQGAKNYSEFVSFNGREFDAPFLAIRSAINKIKPPKNLLANRYLTSQPYSVQHIDLRDQLSFYGASRRKGSLHLYCRAFGIKSPKSEGITGDDVGRLFKEKKYLEIARYNSWDLLATWELYNIWKEYVKI